MIISVDIGGGPGGAFNHFARYVLNIHEAIQLARGELVDGYLVNMQSNPHWEPENNFDSRASRESK
jgi:hypothetical protein